MFVIVKIISQRFEIQTHGDVPPLIVGHSQRFRSQIHAQQMVILELQEQMKPKLPDQQSLAERFVDYFGVVARFRP